MAIYHRVIRSNIAAELGRKGISQREAANRLDLSPASFGSRLAGRTEFRLGELIRLSEIIGVSFLTLIEGVDSENGDIQVTV